MSILKQEVKNTRFMVDKLAESINTLMIERSNNITEENFKDVENDDCETRSRGICTHDTIATEALNLIPTLADVNWEVFAENLSENDMKSLKYALSNTVKN
jgi:hypothetical protein